MFQEDPRIRLNDALESLGMEARSILRSIQTESSKLEQSNYIARSDLHYFRARFNYYRLSLMRLLPFEREILEPVLSQFMELIADREADNSDGLSPQAPVNPPFLESLPEKRVASEPKLETKSFVSQAAAGEKTSVSEKAEIVSELSLLKLALQAPPSIEGNQLVSKAIARVIEKLSS